MWRSSRCLSTTKLLSLALQTEQRSITIACTRYLSTSSTLTATTQESWPVVISGAGPTGLTTAYFLARFGVPCLVLERSEQLTDHPQAHFINHRTMEVFRSMDGLAEEVSSTAPPLREWREFVYCTSMLGDIIGTVDHFKGQTTPHSPSNSPEPVAHLAQHRLLPLIASRTATQPTVDLRMGHSVLHSTHSSDPGAGGRVTVERCSAQGGGRYEVQYRYLVAADGARGPLRRQLGVDLKGPGGIQHLINVYFNSAELGRKLKDRPGMLYFVFNPTTIAIIVAHDITKGEFVAQIPYFPPLQSPGDFTFEGCAQLLKQAAGLSSLDLKVRGVRPWVMSAAVAETYSQGPVILAGDAAHVVPPAGAFGMNTGIQDAHNLAWKLAALIHGQAGQGLLQTYETERKPVAISNMNLSVDNFHEALRLPEMMGLDFRTANTINNWLVSQTASWVPEAVRKGFLDTIITAGRTASSVIGAARRSDLEAHLKYGYTLRLQYPKEDLGFVYGKSGAVCYQGDEDDVAVKAYTAPKPRDAPYIPALLPGGRLPHFPIEIEQLGVLNTALLPSHASSIDVSAAGGCGMVLLLSAGQAIEPWISAAQRINNGAGGMQVVPIVIRTPTQPQLQAPPDVAVVTDVGGKWADLAGEFHVVLVRPDGHVAWRCRGLYQVEQQGSSVEGALAHALDICLSL